MQTEVLDRLEGFVRGWKPDTPPHRAGSVRCCGVVLLTMANAALPMSLLTGLESSAPLERGCFHLIDELLLDRAREYVQRGGSMRVSSRLILMWSLILTVC